MGIELTAKIAQLLSKARPSDHSMLLQMAWNACCDGALLQRYGIANDLWNGLHEDERRELETRILEEIIAGDRETCGYS